ncbi:MAG: hypothetical protein ACPG5B_01290 [Chitinophagales bacterium]
MKKKFEISLKDNGIHSLNRGLDTFKLYEKEKKDFQLKEAIMFLHHGIELLMKQVLIENSGEYLIYSDIGDVTIKKVINAKKQGISVFDLAKPPHTSTYLEAISRVRAFVDILELEESLETRLKDLNKIRNKLEHYAINMEIGRIEKLITQIRNPLIKFFEETIKEFKEKDAEKVKEKWENVSGAIMNSYIFQLIQKFKGQKIAGELLGIKGEFQLPHFRETFREKKIKFGNNCRIADILAIDNKGEKWVIEIRNGVYHSIKSDINRVLSLSKMVNGIPWLIVFDVINEDTKFYAKESGILITDVFNLNELEKIISK